MLMTDLRLSRIFSAALCAALLTSGLALAQAKPATPGAKPAPGKPAAGRPGGPPPYDKATETTIKGPIQEVKLVDTPSGVQGTHLMMKQGTQTIEVFAGPAPYFARQNITFTKGTAIEVLGSKVQVQGVTALLAREIKMGGKTLKLRDESGQPAWARNPS
jgi:hypothetical protein